MPEVTVPGGAMYKAVYFDAFNTLIGVHWPGSTQPRQPRAQRAVERCFGRLDAGWQAAYGRSRCGPRAECHWHTHILAALADGTGVSRGNPIPILRRNEAVRNNFFEAYLDTLAALPILNGLCKLGIISNAWPYLESVLKWLGLWQYFESVIISAQVGHSKPGPAIYELALRALHVKAPEALFVDDTPQNVLAAERMGFKGLWLVRDRPPYDRMPLAYRDLTQIFSLEQIIPLVQVA